MFMPICKTLFFSLMCLFISSLSYAEQLLKLEQAYAISGISNLQPSGLTKCGDELLFVSDKHESTVFKIEITGSQAQAVPFINLQNIPAPPKHDYPVLMDIQRFLTKLVGINIGADWEGISCNQKGQIFLASEYLFSVLKIDTDGATEWVVNDLFNVGYRKGLFQKNNAYIEGITVYNSGLLLVAEREPRGLISISSEGDFHTFVDPHLTTSEQRISLDYAGLAYFNNKIYTLERNLYRVCHRNPSSNEVGQCYSFKHVALSKQWGYDTGIYGLAEGLAIDDKNLWIIVDNNKDTRLLDAGDQRAILMKFKNPLQ
jgi:hypothetical protein